MAGAVYDFVTVAQLIAELGAGSPAPSSPQTAYLQTLIDGASLAIERELNRRVVNRGGVSAPSVEYHTLVEYRAQIYTLEAPIWGNPAIVVNEDQSRQFQSGTSLQNGYDYIVDLRRGKITRTSGSYTIPFMPGIRTIQVTYGWGWLGPNTPGVSTPNVPSTLVRICLEMCAAAYQKAKEKLWAMSGKSDSEGNFTKLTQAVLSEDHMVALEPFRRESYWATGESDEDNTQ